MSKKVFRPFWSYNVVKSEDWLSQMHAEGYALVRINFAARLFYFEETMPAKMFYRIVPEKKSNGAPPIYLENNTYTEVCSSSNYYVIGTQDANPETAPSYSGFLCKNKKFKYAVGAILLCVIISSFPDMIIFVMLMGRFLFPDGGDSEFSSYLVHTPHAGMDVFDVVKTFAFPTIVLLTIIWLCYTYFKLRKTNRQLEKLCGDTLNLSFTLPIDTLISDVKMRKMSKDHKVIKKTKIAWFYEPDKIEIWLENMESRGYNLVRMSSMGNSFYFISGEPRKMKFHFDYQNITDPSYFNLNKESGWKLFFTSLSRMQCSNVWGKEYTEEPPQFYSDKDSKRKNAKRFALTYSLIFGPLCAYYIYLMGQLLFTDFLVPRSQWFTSDYIIISLFALVCVGVGSCAVRTIRYYFRIKKR